MAYNGSYPEQRPYVGRAGKRPPPPRGPPGGYPQQQAPPQQHYDDYQNDYGYGYDQYDDGYGYGDYGPPQGDAYGRGPPPPPQQDYGYPARDVYGPGPGPGTPMRGGRPPVRGRGAPMRGPPPGPGRGRGPPGPGPGPGGPSRGFPPGHARPPPRSATADPHAGPRGPPMRGPPEPAYDQGFNPGFDNSYAPYHPPGRGQDFEYDQQLPDQMAGMSINGNPQGMHQQSSSMGNGPRGGSMDEYTRPSMDSQRSGGRGPPPRGYPGGAGPRPDQAYGAYPGNGYGGRPSPPKDDFGPPSRSQTMPVNESTEMYGPLPQRNDSAPYGGIGHGAPQRPSTSSGHRPPPQRGYPGQEPPPVHQIDMNGAWNNEPSRGSYGDIYDSYQDDRVSATSMSTTRLSREEIPDFDAVPSNGHRDSFEAHLHAGPVPELQHPGPARTPEMSRAKSQPNLREPQAAVFEMAGDMPPMPTGGFKAYNGQMGDTGYQSPPEPHNYPDPVRSPPQAPPNGPGGPGGLGGPGGPGMGPAPIRAGHQQNFPMNMNNKPAPVRNYGGVAPPAEKPPPVRQYGNAAGTAPAAAAGARGRAQPQPQTQSLPSHAPPAVAQKPPVTVEELDRLRAVIKNNPNDQHAALTLAKKLMEGADTLVPKMPDAKSRARARDRYVVDAHKILKKLVSAQNADAMFFLADLHGRGAIGHEPDTKEAFTLYQSAAKIGHPAAAYRTAVCCEIGNDEGGGTRKDPLKAMQWYKRAATLGDTPAMYKVGMIMLKGLLGQQRDHREAVGWLKRAAERSDEENPHALHELALLYMSAAPNDSIIRDERYAVQLFHQAADLGYKFSQYQMGLAYEYGKWGLPIDHRQSINWYSKAAQQEEHQSELALSGWYLTGADGVLQPSETEAMLWAKKAAMAGLPKAEYAMGYFTEVGIGVAANLEDAKRWYWRAAAQNYPEARERLEDLKKNGRSGPRQRERISRSKMESTKTGLFSSRRSG